MDIREPAIDYNKKKYSIEEYLEIEDASVEKHDYYKGEIFAMSGARVQHNKIAKNILVTLENAMEAGPCEPFGSDSRVHVEKNSLYTYPDVFVVCGEPQHHPSDDIGFLNPCIIFEVLSPSTKNYDLGQKFSLYKDIPTLSEYITIDPAALNVHHNFKNNSGNWETNKYSNIDDSLPLAAVSMLLPLKTIYKRIALSPDQI